MSHRIRLSLAALGLISAFATATTPALAGTYQPRVSVRDLSEAGYTEMAGGGWTNGRLTWNCSDPAHCVRN